MKKIIIIPCLCAVIALASCKGKSYKSTDSTNTATDSVTANDSTPPHRTDTISNGVTKGVNTNGKSITPANTGTSPNRPAPREN